MRPAHVADTGKPVLDPLLEIARQRVTAVGERVAWYLADMPTKTWSEHSLRMMKRLRRLLKRAVAWHLEGKLADWAGWTKYTFYTLMRAEWLVLSNESLGHGPHGLQMPGVCVIPVKRAQFHHLIAIYEVLNHCSEKLRGVIFLACMADFVRMVPSKARVETTDEGRTEVINHFKEAMYALMRSISPVRNGGKVLVVLPARLDPADQNCKLWERVRAEMIQECRTAPRADQVVKCGVVAQVDTIPTGANPAIFMVPNKYVYRPGDVGCVLQTIEQLLADRGDTERPHLLFNLFVAANYRWWQELVREVHGGQTIVDSWFNSWYDDTTCPLEPEWREATLAHTQLGRQHGMVEVQRAYEVYRRTKQAVGNRPDPDNRGAPHYRVQSMAGCQLGEVETRLVILVRNIVEQTTDSQEVRVLFHRLTLHDLAERFSEHGRAGESPCSWEQLFDDVYAAWGANFSQPVATQFGTDWPDTPPPEYATLAQLMSDRVDEMRVADLIALVLVFRGHVLSKGLLALWGDHEWSDNDVSAFLALGGSVRFGELLGRGEQFRQVQNARCLQLLQWIARQPVKPAPVEVAMATGLSTPHLKDILGEAMCTALWGPGACEFPPGLRIILRRPAMHVLGYAPLLVVGVPLQPITDPIRAIRVPLPRIDLSWDAGRPSRPRLEDVDRGMKVNVQAVGAEGHRRGAPRHAGQPSVPQTTGYVFETRSQTNTRRTSATGKWRLWRWPASSWPAWTAYGRIGRPGWRGNHPACRLITTRGEARRLHPPSRKPAFQADIWPGWSCYVRAVSAGLR